MGKPSEIKWFEVVEFSDGETIMSISPDGESKNERPVILQRRFYDEDGNPVLLVATVDMDGVPPAAMERARLALAANQIEPTLLLPRGMIHLASLKPISDAKAKRLVERAKKAAESKRKASEPSVLVKP